MWRWAATVVVMVQGVVVQVLYYSRCTSVEVERARRAAGQAAGEAFLGLRGRQCRHLVCWPPCLGLDRHPTHQTRGPRPGVQPPPPV